LRAAQLVPGFGPASARRLSDAMAAAEDAVAALHAFKPPAASLEDWSRFLALYDALRAHADWPGELQAVQRWYAPLLASLHDDAPTRLADIEQLARLAGGYPSRERFLTELTLDPPSATSDESQEPGLDEDYLILSTIHSAKGQEWHAVYVLNVVDGCIPSDMATGSAAEIDEERRLLYVAMTRARERLHLLVPQRFYVTQQSSLGDRHLYGALTRFIPPEVARHFAWVGPHSAAPEITTAASQAEKPGPLPAPGFDIAARARARWSS
jgi:DNA helicase-2/ATP-dependent DNA helicase PcrA